MTRQPKGPKATVAWLIDTGSCPDRLVTTLAPHGKVYLAVPRDAKVGPDLEPALAAVLRTDGEDGAAKLASLATEDSESAWHVTLRSDAVPTDQAIGRFLQILGGLSYQTKSVGVEPKLGGVFRGPTDTDSRADRSSQD